MKNGVKFISLVVFAVLCSLFICSVKAEGVVAGGYVGKVYMKKVKGEQKGYLRSQWVLRASDNQFVYCIEPWAKIHSEEVYEQKTTSEYTNISPETMERVKLLAYYGYGYEGHEDENWYTITQLMIWRAIDPDGDFYFTDVANGTRISLFENEMTELDRLVNEHSILPSFVNQNYTNSIKRDLVLTDSNNVLDKFNIIKGSEFVKAKGNNYLTLKSDSVALGEIELTKKANKYNTIPFVYVNDQSQNVLTVGNFDDLITKVNVEFRAGKINLTKKSNEKNYNDKITLENAQYEVFDDKGNSMGIITTDKNGFGTLDNLPYGVYTVKEIKASYGYAIDPTIYKVEINDSTLEINLEVYEKLDKKELEITKEYLDALTGETNPESNVYFDIYTEDGDYLVGSVKTNEAGKASLKLSYGRYIVRQRNGKSGYIIADDFLLIIDENTPQKLSKKIINYPEEKPEEKLIVNIPNTAQNKMDTSLLLIILLLLKLVLGKQMNYENN